MDEVVKRLIALRDQVAAGASFDEDAAAIKRVLLDSLGCALGAAGSTVPDASVRVARRSGGAGASTLIGVALRVGAEEAAFANSVLVRYLDFNDTYASSDGLGHPSDYVSAVLAVGEECDADGGSVLAGISAVYDVFCRLTDALPLGFNSIDHVVYGAVASAYGAGILWGLSDHALADAISLALVANVSLLATRFGSLSAWKGCAAGNAARNGVFAARLALEGIDGPPSPFEGRGGLSGVLGRQADLTELGRHDRGPAAQRSHLKNWPCSVLAQSAIEASIQLHGRFTLEEVRAVTVWTFKHAITMMAGDAGRWSPATPSTADHSLPYVVARALVDGNVSSKSFELDALSDPRVRRLMSQLSVEEATELTARWPAEMPARVEIDLSSGERLEVGVDAFGGSASNPMTAAHLEAKFRLQAEPKLGADGAARVISACHELENVGARELLLACTPSTGRMTSAAEE